MSLKQILSYTFVALALCLSANANNYSTKGLERLAECVGIQSNASLAPGVHNTFIYKGRKLTVRVNKWNEVEHIGLLLFPQGIRQLQPLPIYDFLERYLLASNALPADADERVNMAWDKVHFAIGNAQTAMTLDTTATFEEKHVDLHVYKVAWSMAGQKVLEMSFYMDYQLLTGCNAIELEGNLFKKLHRGEVEIPVPKTIDIPTDGTEYTLQGKYFISPYVRNDVFYTRKDTTSNWEPVNDSLRMIKTISNILIAEGAEHDLKVKIKLDKYGLRKDSAMVDYRIWKQMCLNEGCTPYFGLKSKQDKVYKCSVFMVNETGGYLHLLSIDVPQDAITHPDKKLALARIYCYIPLHNVSENILKPNEFEPVN